MDNDKAVAVCSELIKELPVLLEELAKTSSLFAAPLVLDHLLLLIHFVRAVVVELHCCKRGPLRCYLQTGVTKPAVLQIITGPERYQLYQQLTRWCGTGKGAQSRVVSGAHPYLAPFTERTRCRHWTRLKQPAC